MENSNIDYENEYLEIIDILKNHCNANLEKSNNELVLTLSFSSEANDASKEMKKLLKILF